MLDSYMSYVHILLFASHVYHAHLYFVLLFTLELILRSIRLSTSLVLLCFVRSLLSPGARIRLKDSLHTVVRLFI